MRVPRTAETQYRQRLTLAMTAYVGVMLPAWPLVRTADGMLPKIALALAALVTGALRWRHVRSGASTEDAP